MEGTSAQRSMSSFKTVLGIKLIEPDFLIGQRKNCISKRLELDTWSFLTRGRRNLPDEVNLTGGWFEGRVSKDRDLERVLAFQCLLLECQGDLPALLAPNTQFIQCTGQ